MAVAVRDRAEAEAALAQGVDLVLASSPLEGIGERLYRSSDGETPPAAPRFLRPLARIADPRSFAGAGWAGLLLDPPTHLLATYAVPELASFANACREADLECWFGGQLERPDIPRLAALSPTALLLSGDPAFFLSARKLLDNGAMGLVQGEARTDRILVRNLVLPMEIGAYRSEHGRSQRVRFTVEADVLRRPSTESDMADIYSYDLITDAIRDLAARGHVELVETLAEQLAARVLADRRVKSVLVRVEKLDLGPEAVGIEILRP